MVHTLLVLKPLVFGSGHVYCYIRHHVKGWTVMVQGVLLILLAWEVAPGAENIGGMFQKYLMKSLLLQENNNISNPVLVVHTICLWAWSRDTHLPGSTMGAVPLLSPLECSPTAPLLFLQAPTSDRSGVDRTSIAWNWTELNNKEDFIFCEDYQTV